VYALLDALLLPWVAGVLLIRVLLKAGNRRNLPLGAILVLLASANLAFHAADAGMAQHRPAARAARRPGALIVMIECVIAGRVIPAFTMSALPGRQLQTPPWLERAALATTALSLAAWVLLPVNPITAAGLSLAALLHTRLWHWQPWRTKARPILWVLHMAYAWLPVGFALLAAAQMGFVSLLPASMPWPWAPRLDSSSA
jgi:uncharacterized protein involved in response to NO